MKEVALKIRVPVSTYRDWEYGSAIQGTPYVKLSEVFDVSLYELLTGAKPKLQNILSLIETAEATLVKVRSELGPLL